LETSSTLCLFTPSNTRTRTVTRAYRLQITLPRNPNSRVLPVTIASEVAAVRCTKSREPLLNSLERPARAIAPSLSPISQAGESETACPRRFVSLYSTASGTPSLRASAAASLMRVCCRFPSSASRRRTIHICALCAVSLAERARSPRHSALQRAAHSSGHRSRRTRDTVADRAAAG